MTGAASELCQRCGLCCDGSLFARAPLLPDEVAPLAARGLPATAAGLPQPCAALEGTRCSIYAARPASCRRYTCLLQAALAEGEVDLDEALAVVAEARARLAAGEAGEHLDRHFRGRSALR
ncbi:MAG: YkgJ family cysteine cluster protein [Planctomycetes bacterium]|nr:YkgJ family cysteine cluster protein [Planctomycetota bacterium]